MTTNKMPADITMQFEALCCAVMESVENKTGNVKVCLVQSYMKADPEKKPVFAIAVQYTDEKDMTTFLPVGVMISTQQLQASLQSPDKLFEEVEKTNG